MAIHKDSIVDVDLTSGTIHRSFLNHSIGMNDSDGDFFGVRVFKGGVPVDLTNVSVQGHFNPPVGAPIFLNAGNYISGNVATVRLPQACYNYEGPFSLAIKLVTVNETVTVRIVDGMVDNTYVEGSVAPTGTVPTYQEVLAEYDQMVAATATANAAAQTAVNTANTAAQTAINTADTAAANCAAIVAAPYSNSATYAVGSYCTKDGKLYECTTAITTAEEWTAGHWTETKVGPEVSDLKSAFDEEKIRTIFGYRAMLVSNSMNWVSGGINSSTGGNTTNSKRIKAGVQGSCDEILIHCAIPMRIAVFAYTRDRSTGDYVGMLQSLVLTDTEGNVIVKASKGLMHVVMAAYPTEEDISTSAAENITVYKCFQPKFENDESAIFGNVSDSTIINGNMLRWCRGNIQDDGTEAGINVYAIFTMDYIPVIPGRIIKFTGVVQTLCYIALYDEDKEFLERVNLLEDDYIVKSGVAFVRFCYGNTTASGIKITDGVDTLNKFQVTVINNTFAQYLERIGYLPFVVVKGIYRSDGLINKNSDGICQSEPFKLRTGSTIRVNISGDWIYSVWQGDATNNLTKTDRLVNYDEVEVQHEYVAFCFYKLDENGNVINATPDDFNQSVMLFNSGNTTKREIEMHDIPENIGVLNVINRAYQMAKLTYTPVANLPTQVNTTKYPGYVPSGTKVKGVMYSSVRNEALYVPQCVSLDTYMTALLNPNSYIYTRTEPSPHYNALTYYGAVCSSMVAWCYGIDKVIPTTISFDTYDGMEVIENQSPYGLKLGDMLNRSDHHIVIITDIVRNNRGIISKIEVSEQVSSNSHPMTRRQYLTPTQIQSNYFNVGYVAMRYHYIYKVPYTASPWVNLDDEAEEPAWNHNLSPRRGDKANWRPGETIEIDVMDAEEYTGVKLFKGDELQETITIPSGNPIQYVGLDAGTYKVCLTDGENDSDFVYFSIIDNEITYTALGNGAVRVEFSSENGIPASISFCESKSSDSDYKAVRGFHVLTDAEIAAGEAVVNAPTTETRSTWLMKVMFNTPFGLYSSDLESVEIN